MKLFGLVQKMVLKIKFEEQIEKQETHALRELSGSQSADSS